MSYRNPQIIVDRSAEIYAQASAQFGQQLAQGVQNYFDNRKKKAEAIRKKKNAYQLALNDVTLNYNNSLNAATEDINQSTLFKDVQAQARARLDGNEFGIGVIEMATQLKMNPDLDRNTRAQYLKAVSDYQTWQNGIVNKIGATLVDIEPLEGMNAGNIGQGYDFAGTGNEKFQNMVVANTLANKSFSGIQTSKTLNGNMLDVNMVINPNDKMIKKYVEDGILDLNDLKAAEDGNYYLNWTRNIDKWEGGLITQVPSAFDGVTALETAGIVDNKGLPKEGFFTEKIDVVKNVAGTDKQRVFTKQYFNPDVLENNPTFKAEALKYAKGLNQLPTGQILSALENHFDYEISANDWLSKNAEQQNKIITNLITNKEIDRMTGGFQQEVVDNEVRYYQQSEGKLIERPSNNTENEKLKVENEKQKTILNRIDTAYKDTYKEEMAKAFLSGSEDAINQAVAGFVKDLGFGNDVSGYKSGDEMGVNIQITGKKSGEDTLKIPAGTSPDVALARIKYALTGDVRHLGTRIK